MSSTTLRVYPHPVAENNPLFVNLPATLVESRRYVLNQDAGIGARIIVPSEQISTFLSVILALEEPLMNALLAHGTSMAKKIFRGVVLHETPDKINPAIDAPVFEYENYNGPSGSGIAIRLQDVVSVVLEYLETNPKIFGSDNDATSKLDVALLRQRIEQIGDLL